MADINLTLLEKLCRAFAPSGCEEELAEVISKEARKYTDDVKKDVCGNVIAHLRSGRGEEKYDPEAEPVSDGKPDIKRLMLTAPMDEQGFMVSGFDGDYVKMTELGKSDAKLIAGRNVVISNGAPDGAPDGDFSGMQKLEGYIGIKPAHLGGVGDFGSLYIDTGAKDRKAEDTFPANGDFVTMRSDFVTFGKDNSRICSKALDSRAPCLALLEAMRALSAVSLPYDVYFVFSARSRISISGAHAAALAIRPDYALIVDSMAVTDYLGDNVNSIAKLEGGAVFCYSDSSALYDREFADYIIDTAAAKGIRHCISTKFPGGCDTGDVNPVAEGVRVARVSVPVRNPSTAAVVCSACDIEAVTELLIAATAGE